jgi:hypothetical protein
MASLPPPCLEAALAYLQRGWSAIALCPPDHHGVPGEHQQLCKSPGKAPLWSWKAYQERLPREQELHLWWSRNPRSNVGVCLGPVSGLVGIDIDDQTGLDLLADLCNGIPDTFNFSTPGGSHRRRLFFRHPEEPVPTRSLRVNGVEVLRIQGKGAQTVMPPSIHPAGGTYGLIRGRHADFHSFRYTFCSLMGRILPIQKVKVLMRHSTITLTADLYLDLGIDDTAEGVWTLPRLQQPAQPPEHPGTVPQPPPTEQPPAGPELPGQ